MPSARALKAGKAIIELSLSDSQIGKQIDRLRGRLKALGSHVTRFGKAGIAAGGAIVAAFVPAISAASNMQEVMGKFDTVFGAQSKAVKQWGDEYASQVGRSQRQLAEFLAGNQDLFVPLGFEAGQATELSKQVTKLAIDLASFNNQTDADAMRDLQAALTGSGETMKKYGVIVNEAAVKQELLNTGINPTAATEQQKVMGRLAIIMRGTTAAQGDAIRTAGSFANQMKALKGEAENLAVAIGNAVLPYVTKFVSFVRALIPAITSWIKENGALVAIVGGLGAAVAAAGVVVTTFGVAIGGAAAALTALLTPVGATIALIGTLGAAIAAVTAYFVDWDKAISKVSKSLGEAVAYLKLMNKLKGIFKAGSDPFGSLQDIARENDKQPAAAATTPAAGAAAAAKPGADNAKFRADAKRVFSNLLGMLPGKIHAAISGDKLPPEVEAAFNRLGQVMGNMNNAMAIAAAPEKLQGLDTHFRTDPRSIFDTRLSPQMFGATSKIEEEQLKTQKKMLAVMQNRRGGIPVV
jgi:hypothetical protein